MASDNLGGQLATVANTGRKTKLVAFRFHNDDSLLCNEQVPCTTYSAQSHDWS